MSPEALEQIRKLDNTIEALQAIIRDVENERNKIILREKEKANE